jgi:hypothetical protein
MNNMTSVKDTQNNTAANDVYTANKNDASLPLTKDEIALFKTVMKTPDEVVSQFTAALGAFKNVLMKHTMIEDSLVNIYQEQRELKSAIADLAVANNSIAEAVTKSQEMSRKQIYSVSNSLISAINKFPATDVPENKMNSLFTTTLTEAEQKNWKEKAIGTISGRSFDYGCNKDEDYAAIYDKMKKAGYDVSELIKEYAKIHPNASILDMCAASEKLRTSFERGLSNLCHKSIVKKIKSNIAEEKPNVDPVKTMTHVTYRKANSIPPEIRTMVAKLSNTGTPNGWCYKNAKKILRANNIDLNMLVAKVKKEYSVSNCSEWFAVSKSPEVMKLLNNQINKAAKSAEVK